MRFLRSNSGVYLSLMVEEEKRKERILQVKRSTNSKTKDLLRGICQPSFVTYDETSMRPF